MKFVALMMAVILGASVAANAVSPQEQASNLAVPEVVLTMESAVLVTNCSKLVGLVLVDSLGGLHPVDLSTFTVEQVRNELLAPLDKSKVVGVVLPCGARDGTPLG